MQRGSLRQKSVKFANGKGAAEAKLSVDKLLTNSESIWGKSPQEIASAFKDAGYEAVIEPSTKGSKLSTQIRINGHPEITNIQVHPGGGRHGGSYYKISTSTQGKIKVVNPDTYVSTPNEKVTIIETPTNKPKVNSSNNDTKIYLPYFNEKDDEEFYEK